MGKVDLHIHTIYSWDGTCSVPAVLKQAAHIARLDVIAITDHDEIAGALVAEKLAAQYGIEVIPGSEISTADGHLIALFIREKIPAGLSLAETVLKVGEQGGLCIAAHPTARGSSSLSGQTIRETLRDPRVARILVGIEIFNAGIVHRKGNKHAQALARTLPVAPIGSSDSHLIWTIGKGNTEFAGRTAADFRRALESRTTTVRIGKEVSPVGLILGWVRGFLLRKAGWVECNFRPEEPVTLGKITSASLAATLSLGD
ncbi:MAG TPA: PHP-associated domain-containing protein [Anaerolineales bacterium]|nr:PHP-associated domain-containing protein [Anaerolineales bacterium]